MKTTANKAKSASKVSSRVSLEGSVPKLRFPGFEGAWGSQIFSNAFAFIPNNTLSRSELTYSRGKVRNIHYGDILVKFGDVIDFRNEEVPYIANQQQVVAERSLRDGDIIIADTAEDETVGKASEIYGLYDAEAEAGLHTIACRPLQKFAPRFIAYYLNSPAYHRHLLPLMQGIKVLSLSKSQISNTKICVPHAESEQKKIASFLSFIDARITAQRRLVELLKRHKRGLSNALFSGKRRIGNDGKWKTYRLGDLVRRITRKNNTASDVPLTISAQHGLIDQREFFSKSVASADMSGYYLLKQGEFAYNRSSSGEYPFGSIKRLERYPQGAVSTLYICFETIDGNTTDFLKWYFDSSAWHKEIGMICAEGARNHGLLNVPTDGFFNTNHTLPSDKGERKKIAAVMALADARCERAEAELTRLMALKSGLLQQLFV